MVDIRLGSMIMETAGDGPAVVMVHGLGGCSNSFQTLMACLAGYRVLRPDLPGAGRSPVRPGLPGLRGLVSALWDGLRAAGINRAHFVGHSMGTLVCQYLAATTPSAVASLTLFGPILELPPAARQAVKERAATALSQGMAGIAEAVANVGVAPGASPVVTAFVRESLLHQEPAGYAAHCRAIAAADAADHGAIKCPTLLIAGAEDPVAPVAMARQLQERIIGARLEVIPGIAHWMMIEAPARSGELLREHLDATAV